MESRKKLAKIYEDPLLYLDSSGTTYSNVVSEDALESAGITLPKESRKNNLNKLT
jgi:hypothetical protein